MREIKKEIIKPLSSKKENIYLFTVVILIILIATFLVHLRHRDPYTQKINSNEISAYEDLSSIELGIYSDLLNALFDISIIKEENDLLPEIDELEKEEISPFYRDSSWEMRGALEWSDIIEGDEGYYIGISRSPRKIGSFLIEINSANIDESNIYHSRDPIIDSEIFKGVEHLKTHFKKIIPYTGKDERKKFKGE